MNTSPSHAARTHESSGLLARFPYPVFAQGQELAEREVAALARGDGEEGVNRLYHVRDGCFTGSFEGGDEPLEGLQRKRVGQGLP